MDQAATQFISALELKAGDAERGFEPLVVDEKYQDYVNKTLMPLLEGELPRDDESDDNDSFKSFDQEDGEGETEPVDVQIVEPPEVKETKFKEPTYKFKDYHEGAF